jgi:hypothetical protein
MNGKRAKKLRRAALVYIVSKMEVKASEGYNEYNQAMNRFDWAGTITCAWKWRVMYQSMKKRWMDRLKK